MIQIIVVSDTDKHFNKWVDEYIKRLWKWVKITKIKPEKNRDEKYIINKETKKIIELLKKERGIIVGLDDKWELLSTIDFKEFVLKTLVRQSKITFIIWGAYWYSKKELNPYLNKTISLSKMTFPHSMAFLILLEQVYRIKSIENNSWYHH